MSVLFALCRPQNVLLTKCGKFDIITLSTRNIHGEALGKYLIFVFLFFGKARELLKYRQFDFLYKNNL